MEYDKNKIIQPEWIIFILYAFVIYVMIVIYGPYNMVYSL